MFVDQVLMKKVARMDRYATRIDSSWRKQVNYWKSRATAIPFFGEFTIIRHENYLLVKGFEGKLTVNRIILDNTYYLTEPISKDDFIVYAYFNQKGQFVRLCSPTPIGAHYTGINHAGMQDICHGGLSIKTDNLDNIFASCKELAESMSIINMHSKAEIFFPKSDYSEKLKYSMKNLPNGYVPRFDYWSEVADVFLEEDLIKPLL